MSAAGGALVVAAAGAYGFGARRLRGRGGWPIRRSVAFAAGVAALLAGLGLGPSADEQLSAHMVQHLLMTLVAAPLLVLGAPLRLALRALGPSGRRSVRHMLWRPLRPPGPVLSWGLFMAVLALTHLPAVYGLALRDPVAHGLGHLLYMAAAVIFWMPLLGAASGTRRLAAAGGMVYLLLAMPVMGAVGVVLSSSDAVAYPEYLAGGPGAPASALADQRLAGTLMWVGSALPLVAALLLLAWRWLEREERVALALEAHRDRARTLPP